MKSKANESIKISLTFEWTTTKKEWEELLAHNERLKANPQIELQYDAVSSFWIMNNLGGPNLTKIQVIPDNGTVQK